MVWLCSLETRYQYRIRLRNLFKSSLQEDKFRQRWEDKIEMNLSCGGCELAWTVMM